MMPQGRFRDLVVATTLVVGAFFVTLLVRPGGEIGVRWIDDITTFVAAVVACGACVVAAVRRGRGTRAGWIVVAAGMALWSWGEGAWGWFELGTGSVPFPSVADVGYLLAVPVVAVGLLLFPSPGGLVTKTRSFLDAMIVGGSMLVVSWAIVLGPIYRSGTGSMFDQAITLAYPLGDVVLFTIVVTVLSRQPSWRRSPLVLIGVGLIAMAISDSVYAYLTQVSSYSTGGFVDVGWVAGYLLIALAAVRPGSVDSAHQVAQSTDDIPLARILLPYGVLLMALVTGLVSAVRRRQDDPVLLGVGVALGVLVVARQFLTLLDNRDLNTTLHQKIAELGARERQLEHLAFHDALTGLPNRSHLLRRLDTELVVRASTPGPLTIMFVDLDDFKMVNDSLGHEAGDQLLIEVAARIRGCLGPLDLAARLGGDEFGLLILGPRPTALAAALLDAMREPVIIGGHAMKVRASIGIATSDDGHEPADELLRQADTAMYAAKSRGKGTYEVFESHMGDMADERLELRSALQAALGSDELALHYQPIFDLTTGQPIGAEALARWTHPTRGPIPPAVFIPLAEENGLIDDLGRWALLRACEEATRWDGYGLTVNLSAAQVQDSAIVEAVAQALAVTGLSPSRLTLEITESVVMRNTERTLARLRALRAIGARVAIDDFGTGYSSLSYLPRFPVDVIKIDQSFVRGIASEPGRAVLQAILDLARQLGLDAVAEGIETAEQAALLRAAGCRFGQGYWLAMPVPPAELWTPADPAAGVPPGVVAPASWQT